MPSASITPMKSLRCRILTSVLVGWVWTALAAGVEDPRECRVTDLAGLMAAQALVGPEAVDDGRPITIHLDPGDYRLTEPFHIARSRVSLVGEPGARLVLADRVNRPVLSIGSQSEFPSSDERIGWIEVSGVEVDGNWGNQDTEFSSSRPWIRNNGIDVRAVHHLTIRDVSANNNRSGGLVISWDCADVLVTESTFERNFFDGVAYYASEQIVTVDCLMAENGFAGISLDNRLVDSRFADCRLEANGSVGVFARNSVKLRFDNCVIEDSGDWGVFLAHDEKELGVHDVEIAVCQITNNRGGVFMASIDNSQSSGTRVVSSIFRGNEREGRGNIRTSGSPIWTAAIVEVH